MAAKVPRPRDFTNSAKELFAREQALLDEMKEVAEASRGLPDARVRKLMGWIRQHLCPDMPATGKRPVEPARWDDARITIFTEYYDTKRSLYPQLSAVIEGTDQADQRIEMYHGPTPPDKRCVSSSPT